MKHTITIRGDFLEFTFPNFTASEEKRKIFENSFSNILEQITMFNPKVNVYKNNYIFTFYSDKVASDVFNFCIQILNFYK